MRRLRLSPEAEPFRGLPAGRPLLAFDFDGVLAPLVDRAALARLRPETRALLSRLARRVPVAVISGRSLAALRKLTAGLPLAELVGNHGVEWRGHAVAGAAALAKRVARWRRALEKITGDGVELEDKRYSLSVHYRRAKRPAAARRRIRAACAALPALNDARLVPGKRVINVVGAAAPNKGTALAALARAKRATAILFVGDDWTDEDVFALRWRGLSTIRVGRSRRSRAQWYVANQREVDGLLAVLLRMRGGSLGFASG